MNMPRVKSLINKLSLDFPTVKFIDSDSFCCSRPEKTVFYNSKAKDSQSLLMHELAHIVSGQDDYSQDINLVEIERQTWDKAIELAQRYNIKISYDLVEDSLDSYRNWMHSRSTCPECGSVGAQIDDHYQCPACNLSWTTNQAKTKALRRYKRKK